MKRRRKHKHEWTFDRPPDGPPAEDAITPLHVTPQPAAALGLNGMEAIVYLTIDGVYNGTELEVSQRYIIRCDDADAIAAMILKASATSRVKFNEADYA